LEIRKSGPLDESWKYPVSKKIITSAFGNFGKLRCTFASARATFNLDSRCFERPVINGLVVASLSVSRARTALLQIYPAEIAFFGASATSRFEAFVVPHLAKWLQQQLKKPETAVLGHEQIIVSWNGSEFEYAQVRFL
jgi:hypothetical protein